MGDYSVKSGCADNGFLLKCRSRSVSRSLALTWEAAGTWIARLFLRSVLECQPRKRLQHRCGPCSGLLDEEMVDFSLCVVSSYSYPVLSSSVLCLDH